MSYYQFQQLNIDPISPRVEVRAFAGPMTKPQAMEFRKKWKTPPRKLWTPTKRDIPTDDSFNTLTCSRPRDTDIVRLKDTEKGLETVGRNLAEEYSVQWKEFWEFLNDFADLRDNSGLNMLEKYLMEVATAKQTGKLNNDLTKTQNNLNKIYNCDREINNSTSKSLMSDFVNELNHMWDKIQVDEQNNAHKSLDDMDFLIKTMEKCSLNQTLELDESESNDEFYTPPDTPELLSYHESDNESSEDEMFIAEEGDAVFIEGFV